MSLDTHESIRDLAINLWDNRKRMTISKLADELGLTVRGMLVVR